MWNHVLATESPKEGYQFEIEAGNLLRAFKEKEGAGDYNIVKVQRLVTAMTVIDTIYGVKAQFKSSN